MQKKGNGVPERCAANLLRIVRGEVPYDRLRGLSPDHVGKPLGSGVPELRADALWTLSAYEPRVDPSKALADVTDAETGEARVTVSLRRSKGEDDE